jgi:hypothetical protein
LILERLFILSVNSDNASIASNRNLNVHIFPAAFRIKPSFLNAGSGRFGCGIFSIDKSFGLDRI